MKGLKFLRAPPEFSLQQQQLRAMARFFILPFLSLVFFSFGFSKGDERPNIVFMMADDLGYGDVSYNGGNASTPNLDDMAASANSIRLDRYYSGGPVCSPTRGTVLTGRNHNRYKESKP